MTKHFVNHQIDADKVLLIDQDGENQGVVSLEKAIRSAEESGLDLVAVDPNNDPVVCKIMDYGKYRYEQKKKQAQNKAQAPGFSEIRIGPRIDTHDLNVKINQARDMIESNNKVRFNMRFRGREKNFIENGYEIMEEIYENLKDIAKYEKEIKREGNSITMTLVRD